LIGGFEAWWVFVVFPLKDLAEMSKVEKTGTVENGYVKTE